MWAPQAHQASRTRACLHPPPHPSSTLPLHPPTLRCERYWAAVITRILRLLTRLGHLNEEDGQTTLAGGITDPDDVMTPLQAAAAHYRIAQGPRVGQKVLSLQFVPRRPARGDESSPTLCANAHGFSLHAEVRMAADDRRRLQQLCRYIIRRRFPTSA